MSLSGQLKELGQLATNVEDASAKGIVELFMYELADWVRAATRIISETAIEVSDPDRTTTAPEGVPTTMAEMVHERCTFVSAREEQCLLDAEHVGVCRFAAQVVRR